MKIKETLNDNWRKSQLDCKMKKKKRVLVALLILQKSNILHPTYKTYKSRFDNRRPSSAVPRSPKYVPEHKPPSEEHDLIQIIFLRGYRFDSQNASVSPPSRSSN